MMDQTRHPSSLALHKNTNSLRKRVHALIVHLFESTQIMVAYDCVFHHNSFNVKALNLPKYQTFEILGLSVNSTRLPMTLITVYRPGSQHVSSVFFDEFADLLERCSSYSQCVIVGDINIHMDSSSSTCQQFKSLLDDCGMADCVNQPTHQYNHQLDVFISRVDKPPSSLTVEC